MSTAELGRGIWGKGMGGDELVEGFEAGRVSRPGSGKIPAARGDFSRSAAVGAAHQPQPVRTTGCL